MAHPFLLLRLPYLNLDKSIKLMDTRDQFSLSKVSKRSQRVVKCALRNRKYNAALEFEDDVLTVLMECLEVNNEDEEMNRLRLLDLDDTTAQPPIKESITQWFNTFAVNDLKLELCERRCRLVSVVIPVLKQLGLPYGTIGIYRGNKEYDEACELILKACGDAKKLDLYIPTSRDFSLDPDQFGPFQCQHLKIRESSWITLDLVIKWFLNCNHINIAQCDFTASEVNDFLKTWQKGSRIEHFALLYSRPLNPTSEAFLNDISATPARAVSVQRGSATVRGPYNGFVIQQENGRKAFIYRENRIFAMHTKFELEKEDDK